MADNCKGCGAEIFAGQRFCRMCGRATGDLADEQAPTMNMPPPDQVPYPGYQGGGQGPAATAPAQRPDTAPVYPARQQPAYYQAGPSYPAYPPAPVKAGFKWGWVFAFIGIGLFGAIVFAILLFAARARRQFGGRIPALPPAVQSAPAHGEATMDESTASVTPLQTVITKGYPLTPGAALSINNVNGNIHVESWEGAGAQVRIIKVGGSDTTRRRVPIYEQIVGNRLTLRTGDARNSHVDVSYEVMVPREMKSVEITSTNGNIKLDRVRGDISVVSTDGSISLNNIDGSASAKNMNGSITAVFDAASSDKRMAFENMNGSIRLQFKSDVNADLQASTTTGSINLDPEWGIEVKKGFVGASADGPMGTGGPALKVTTINGSISITKAPGTPGQ